VGRGLPGGTLEKLFRLGYDFHDEWDVSRAKFELVTLGALAVIIAIASTRYALGRPMRERQLDLPLTGSPVAGEAAG
jgi:hypothetical protein